MDEERVSRWVYVLVAVVDVPVSVWWTYRVGGVSGWKFAGELALWSGVWYAVGGTVAFGVLVVGAEVRRRVVLKVKGPPLPPWE